MTIAKESLREYKEFLELCRRIRLTTKPLLPHETAEQKQKRIDKLKKNFTAFCKYYFCNLVSNEFAWFHKSAARNIIDDPNSFTVLEWPREHAKSVFADIMLPMFLYANGSITGMVIASANENKASTLLADIRAQFEANELWLNDFGHLNAPGEWRSNYFATLHDCGFWAFGRGQSPRGIRKAAKRPNFCVVDDIDDKSICRNIKRVRDAVDWVLEDLYGALSIQGARMVIAGNRIHKKSILAHLVGDIEQGDPKRKEVNHIKVFALENPKTHRKDDNGKPAWKERYTIEMLRQRIAKIGYRASRREFFHEHIEDGIVFRHEWIKWNHPKSIKNYDSIIIYGDPSFKNTKASDYKAVIAVANCKKHLHILDAWVRQASIRSMVAVFYDLFQAYNEYAQYYIEAGMMQELLFTDEFISEGTRRGYQLPIRQDKRRKPDKFTRIENLTPIFERALISFNAAKRKDPDMQTLIQQLLAFPDGHDDAPDALEGAVSLIRRRERSSLFKPRSGKFQRNEMRI